MPERQQPFAPVYLHAALVSALLAGFPLAAYLATHLGFGLSLSAALPAIIQAHGQVQIFGWLGLFIMGVSLHFLPRLSGVPLARHRRLLAVPGWLVASAVALRTVAQPALALAPDGRWQPYAMVLGHLPGSGRRDLRGPHRRDCVAPARCGDTPDDPVAATVADSGSRRLAGQWRPAGRRCSRGRHGRRCAGGCRPAATGCGPVHRSRVDPGGLRLRAPGVAPLPACRHDAPAGPAADGHGERSRSWPSSPRT